MTRKKPSALSSEPESVPSLPTDVDILVVGAGPAGILAAQRARAESPQSRLLVLEAGDRLGGRSLSGLHLLPESFPLSPLVVTGPLFDLPRVRWDREWISPSEVKWDHRDWGGVRLPQWEAYLSQRMRPLLACSTDLEGIDTRLATPVSKLEKASDAAHVAWKVETPAGTTLARRLIWAAGMTGFQNAFGKQESQTYQAANPLYRMEAADFRGGIALTLTFEVPPLPAEESLPVSSLMAVPVKHEGRFHLMFVCQVSHGGQWLVQSLTHVHRDTLQDPSAVLSFKKSLRRSLRALFANADEAAPREKWIVADRIGGHAYGSLWLLGSPPQDEAIEFACDETTHVAAAPTQDTAGLIWALTAESRS